MILYIVRVGRFNDIDISYAFPSQRARTIGIVRTRKALSQGYWHGEFFDQESAKK